MKGVFKFELSCGRMGDLSGVFVADVEDVRKLYGRNINFGEVLGKHSEISAELDESNCQLVSTEPDAIDIIEKLDLSCGINPLDFYEPDYDEEDSDDE